MNGEGVVPVHTLHRTILETSNAVNSDTKVRHRGPSTGKPDSVPQPARSCMTIEEKLPFSIKQDTGQPEHHQKAA